jgi:hypothetical protein
LRDALVDKTDVEFVIAIHGSSALKQMRSSGLNKPERSSVQNGVNIDLCATALARC